MTPMPFLTRTLSAATPPFTCRWIWSAIQLLNELVMLFLNGLWMATSAGWHLEVHMEEEEEVHETNRADEDEEKAERCTGDELDDMK